MENVITNDDLLKYGQRLPKQFGDFAEQLVLFYLGHSKKMKVAYIDHVGADLLATELGGNERKIAVSVKGRIFKDTTDKAFRFDDDNQTKLRETTKDFGNDYIPVIAFVAVDDVDENTTISIIIGKLETFKNLQDNCSFVTTGKTNKVEDGFNFNVGEKFLNEIQNCDCLEYTKLIFPGKVLMDKKSTEIPKKKFLDC